MWTGSTVDVRMPHLTMGATSFQISIFGLFDSYVTKPSEKCFCHMCRCIIFSLHLGHCVWLGIHTHVCTFQCVCIHSHIYTLCSGYTFACVYTYCAIIVFKMVPRPASSCLQYNHGCELFLWGGESSWRHRATNQAQIASFDMGNIKTFKNVKTKQNKKTQKNMK